MIRLTVTLDPFGDTGLKMVPVGRVYFLNYDKLTNRIIVHTAKKEHYMPGTLKFWVNSLNSSGFVFMIVDRNNAVNVQNITFIDKKNHYAYFDGAPRSKSKKCTMSQQLCRQLIKMYPDIPHITI